jgi:hypothetical protein
MAAQNIHPTGFVKDSLQPAVTITESLPTPPLPLSETIQALKPLLSEKATIYFPADEEFASSTARWSTFRAPQSSAVVNIASEADIAATVRRL